MNRKPVPALIPMALPWRAKGRLAALLDPAQRREVAMASLTTVVEAAAGAGVRPIVLTPDPGALGSISGARLIAERPHVRGLNDALETALRGLDCQSALILHADLPLASAAGLRRLLTGLEGRESGIAIVRSRDGGTNAMMVQPPGLFPLAYGPHSFSAHVAAAHAAGGATIALADGDLALDLDTPADVAALLALPRGRRSRVGNLLRQWRLTFTGLGPAGAGEAG